MDTIFVGRDEYYTEEGLLSVLERACKRGHTVEIGCGEAYSPNRIVITISNKWTTLMLKGAVSFQKPASAIGTSLAKAIAELDDEMTAAEKTMGKEADADE